MRLERNLNYDLMRLIGVFIIIIAHSSPPDWLFQLRNFGTPLLIVGSALTYALIYANREVKIKEFYTKRLSRLVFPAWIFLTFFFLFFFMTSKLLVKDYPFSFGKIFWSYSFIGGIGFVWILKIYIILALLTPAAVYVNKHVKSNVWYFNALISLYILYELSVILIDPHLKGRSGKILESVVLTAAPYTLLYLYGFRLAKLQRKHVIFTACASLAIFAFLFIYKLIETGKVVPTQAFKYPPTIYYLSYAFFALNVVYLFCTKIDLTNSSRRVISWLSTNSLWIYLWHIMAFYIWKFLLPDPNGGLFLFFVKSGFLLGFGVIFTAAQNKLVGMLVRVDFRYSNHIAPMLSTGVINK